MIIQNIRMETFKDVHIVFYGLIPTNVGIDYECTDLWKMARAFGATCHKDLSDSITHVVTSKARFLSSTEDFNLPDDLAGNSKS